MSKTASKTTIRPSLKANDLQHRQAIKKALKDAGISVAAWARENGFERHLVEAVLAGRIAGESGRGHEICVALHLKKPTVPFDPARIATGFKEAA